MTVEEKLDAHELSLLKLFLEHGEVHFTTLENKKAAMHMRDLGYLELDGNVGFYFAITTKGERYLKKNAPL